MNTISHSQIIKALNAKRFDDAFIAKHTGCSKRWVSHTKTPGGDMCGPEITETEHALNLRQIERFGRKHKVCA